MLLLFAVEFNLCLRFIDVTQHKCKVKIRDVYFDHTSYRATSQQSETSYLQPFSWILVTIFMFFILYLYPLLLIVNIEYYFCMDSESIQSLQVLINFENSIILYSLSFPQYVTSVEEVGLMLVAG